MGVQRVTDRVLQRLWRVTKALQMLTLSTPLSVVGYGKLIVTKLKVSVN